MKSELQNRIEQLEDERFKKLCNEVEELHLVVVGNGKKGLVSQVLENKLRITLLLWIFGVLFCCFVATLFDRDAENLQEKIHKEKKIEALNITTNSLQSQTKNV